MDGTGVQEQKSYAPVMALVSNTLDLARRRCLAFELVEAHARVLACKEQIQQAYPFVSEENAALRKAQAHLVEVQRRYDQFWTSCVTTSG